TPADGPERSVRGTGDRIVQDDVAAGRRDHLRDPAAHLAGPDDEHPPEAHEAGGERGPVNAVVRRAASADAREIARVHVETGRHAYAHGFPAEYLAGLSVDGRAALAERLLSENAGTILVAEVDGRIVGFASGGPSRDNDAEAAPGEVYAIYVEPSAWGTGAGRRLLERLEAALRGIGLDEATLWVLEDNPRARRFYEAAGWRYDGGREVFSRARVGAEA